MRCVTVTFPIIGDDFFHDKLGRTPVPTDFPHECVQFRNRAAHCVQAFMIRKRRYRPYSNAGSFKSWECSFLTPDSCFPALGVFKGERAASRIVCNVHWPNSPWLAP
jgi:hypothetical protein